MKDDDTSAPSLSHFDDHGHAVMVDISDKATTDRNATAMGFVAMQPSTLNHVIEGTVEKGDVLGIARIAGITGAKKTADLIPLCHPLPLSKLSIDLKPTHDPCGIKIEAVVKTTGKTGVEMEALTAVSIAALTIYDMLKAVEKTIEIGEIRLLKKEGGKSGVFEAPQ